MQDVPIYIITNEELLYYIFLIAIVTKHKKINRRSGCFEVCSSNNIIKFSSLKISRKNLQIKTNVNSS